MNQAKAQAGTQDKTYTVKEFGQQKWKFSRIDSAFKILKSGDFKWRESKRFTGMTDCVEPTNNEFKELTDTNLEDIKEDIKKFADSPYNAYIDAENNTIRITCHYLSTYVFEAQEDLQLKE